MNSPKPSSFLKRADWGFILILCGLIFLYFYKILGLQNGFYSGDHRQQHYPWAFFYAQQLKQGMLPWWTSLFGCGFPLLAEGQVGALYPLNFIFYKFFPFDFAYTYNILFHYILSGTFFYLLVSSRGLNAFASFLGALIYLFGTSQGGYYYNIISLKTLIWFPLGLFLVFSVFEKKKYAYLFWLALVFFMQLCAGYLQYAVYSILFTGSTCVWLACTEVRRKQPGAAVKGLAACAAALILGALSAFPQLGATWELARFSNRFDFPVEFAFVGSMNPLAIATLFFRIGTVFYPRKYISAHWGYFFFCMPSINLICRAGDILLPGLFFRLRWLWADLIRFTGGLSKRPASLVFVCLLNLFILRVFTVPFCALTVPTAGSAKNPQCANAHG